MIISGDEQNPLKYFKSFGDIANGILLIFWLFIAYITTLGNRCDRADNSYHKKVKLLLSFDLLILDELGFKQLPKHSVDDFFNIIAKRYENKSTIITTNKDFERWNEIFADELLTHAIIDRVVHHAHILNITGKSYRINNYKSGGNMT